LYKQGAKKWTAELQSILSWWAHQDLNLGPKDYAYHYSFRCLFPVCGLDCLLSLRPTRTVSTPSLYCYWAWLGITTHYAQASPNLSSSTCSQSELSCMQPNCSQPLQGALGWLPLSPLL